MVRHLYGYVSMFQLPDLKVFARRQDISSGRSVAQLRSSRAEILDGSFLQPHILLPPPSALRPAPPFIGSLSTSNGSWNGNGASGNPPTPQHHPHRLRHPPSRATFFFSRFLLLLLSYPPSPSMPEVQAPRGKNFRTYESRIKRIEPARR